MPTIRYFRRFVVIKQTCWPVYCVKERLSALDVLVSQPAELDTSWLENEIQVISRRLTETENLVSEVNSRTSIQSEDLYRLVAGLEERLSLLERVGNHKKLLEKARR